MENPLKSSIDGQGKDMRNVAQFDKHYFFSILEIKNHDQNHFQLGGLEAEDP